MVSSLYNPQVVDPDDLSTDRYSMPFFVHPRPEAVLSVLDSCKGEGFPSLPRTSQALIFCMKTC